MKNADNSAEILWGRPVSRRRRSQFAAPPKGEQGVIANLDIILQDLSNLKEA